MEIKYPTGQQDAIAMPRTVHIGAEASHKPNERRDQIRTRLAELIVGGDQAWNAASIAHQVWQQDQLRQARQQSLPGLPLGEPVPMPEWWKAVEEWLSEVEDYLAATPEFGESDAALFRAQEAALDPIPQGKAPLSTEVQTQRTMKLIRLKQDKLRGLRENL